MEGQIKLASIQIQSHSNPESKRRQRVMNRMRSPSARHFRGTTPTMARWAPLEHRRFILATICFVICFISHSSDARCFVQCFQIPAPPPRVLHSATSFRHHHHDSNQARPVGTQRRYLHASTVNSSDESTKSAAKMAPLWTTLAAAAGLLRPEAIGPTLGSLPAVSTSL